MDDDKVVLRHMGEVGTSRTFSHRPNILCARFQAIVDSDVPLFRDLDSRLLKSSAIRVGRTSDRHENVRPLHRSCAAPAFDLKTNVVARMTPDTNHLRV